MPNFDRFLEFTKELNSGLGVPKRGPGHLFPTFEETMTEPVASDNSVTSTK